MITIAELVHHVDYLAPSAPYPAVANALRRAIARFMQESRVFTDEVVIETQDGVSDYVIPSPDCRVIYSIETVRKQRTTCRQTCQDEEIPAAEKCDGFGYWPENLGGKNVVINLQPVPKKEYPVSVTYSWGIGLGDCEIPDQIGTIYLEYIISGALYYLRSMEDEEWTSLRSANDAELRFAFGIKKARNSAVYRPRGVMSMVGRPFLGVKR